jgi:succinyl-diaminopimelate desuccinylase
MDQFPAEVGEPWSVDPYSGEVKDGKIFGRGACDMKGGLTSLLFSFCLIKEMGLELPGKLTLTLVSDEETGGMWGAKWLLDNVPDLLGDACLNTEPSGLTVRIGEKGVFQVLLKAIGKPDHGSYAGYAGDNAIMKMLKVLPSIEGLREVEGRFTEDTEEMIKKAMESVKRQLSHMGDPRIAQVLKHVTVNIGVIRGGTKVNIVPGICEVEVDMRLPLGINQKEMEDKIKEILNKVDQNFTLEYVFDPATMIPAYYTSQNETLFKILQKNATHVTGDEPDVSFSSWASDCRFFGAKNIPSVVYGPMAYNMAAVDECITVDDLLTVTKVHAGTIIEFLNEKINLGRERLEV